MLVLSKFIYIVAMALQSKHIVINLFIRIVFIVIIYAGTLLVSVLYIQSIGSGIGIYDELPFTFGFGFLMDSNLHSFFFIPTLVLLDEPYEFEDINLDLPVDLDDSIMFKKPLLSMEHAETTYTPISKIGFNETVMYIFMSNDSLLYKDALLNEVYKTLYNDESFLKFGGNTVAVALYSVTESILSNGTLDTEFTPYHGLQFIDKDCDYTVSANLAKTTNLLHDYLDLYTDSKLICFRIKKVYHSALGCPGIIW